MILNLFSIFIFFLFFIFIFLNFLFNKFNIQIYLILRFFFDFLFDLQLIYFFYIERLYSLIFTKIKLLLYASKKESINEFNFIIFLYRLEIRWILFILPLLNSRVSIHLFKLILIIFLIFFQLLFNLQIRINLQFTLSNFRKPFFMFWFLSFHLLFSFLVLSQFNFCKMLLCKLNCVS